MVKVMDYPEYKRKYPEKSMSEWFDYQAPLVLENMKKEYQEKKNQLSESEKLEAKKAIKEYESEFID